MDECLAYLQALVADPKSVEPWPDWWLKNCDRVQTLFPRDEYLKLKHRKLAAIPQILIDRGLLDPDAGFHRSPIMGDTHCNVCGTELFWAIPGTTTPEQFDAYADLIGDEQLKRGRWIHPGVYCPNQCTFVMFNMARKPDDE